MRALHRNGIKLKKQKGIALLIFTVVIAMAVITVVVSRLTGQQAELNKNISDLEALKAAKAALIAYAISEPLADSTRAGQFGYLPCPDYTSSLDEGIQDGNCGSTDVNAIGWLPFRTLGLSGQLKDSSGNCLLYAVSGSYKQSPQSSHILNEDTNGQFQIVDASGNITKGATGPDQIVAVVFAPGKALSGQTRNFTDGSICGQDYDNVSAYLEGNGTANDYGNKITNNASLSTDADAVDQFINASSGSEELASNPYNDKLITISRKDIWDVIFASDVFQKKMEDLTEGLATCLANYANDNTDRRLLWPARSTLVGSYDTDSSYDDEDDKGTYGYAGRFPYIIDNSNDDLSITHKEIDQNNPDIAAETYDTNVLFNSRNRNNTAPLCGTVTMSNGNSVSLHDADSEFRNLWSSWKDHFYYALSREYRPKEDGKKDCGTCVRTWDGSNSTRRAGIVFFANERLDDADRSDKSVISAYIDGSNSNDFPDMDGDNYYIQTSTLQSAGTSANDYMFCVRDKWTGWTLDVVSCDGI